MPLLLPLTIIAVPAADLVLAIVRRTWRGQSPFAADRGHLHHRLLEIGHSHSRAVLIMYFWSALFAFGALAYSVHSASMWIVLASSRSARSAWSCSCCRASHRAPRAGRRPSCRRATAAAGPRSVGGGRLRRRPVRTTGSGTEARRRPTRATARGREERAHAGVAGSRSQWGDGYWPPFAFPGRAQGRNVALTRGKNRARSAAMTASANRPNTRQVGRLSAQTCGYTLMCDASTPAEVKTSSNSL